MEKKLEHEHAIACEAALESADVLEPLNPNVPGEKFRWKLLPLQKLGMDSHHYDFFVMGSVEDTDPSSLRQSQGRPPKKIMSKFLFARRLERAHFAPLRIETRHHMRNNAVLAGSVHPLQNDQNRPVSVGVKAFLQLRETFNVGSQKCLSFVLIEINSPGVGRINGCKPKTFGLIDAKLLDPRRDIDTAYSQGYLQPCMISFVAWNGINTVTASQFR